MAEKRCSEHNPNHTYRGEPIQCALPKGHRGGHYFVRDPKEPCTRCEPEVSAVYDHSEERAEVSEKRARWQDAPKDIHYYINQATAERIDALARRVSTLEDRARLCGEPLGMCGDIWCCRVLGHEGEHVDPCPHYHGTGVENYDDAERVEAALNRPPSPDLHSDQERGKGWLFRFTDDDLNAIYWAIENAPTGEGADEEALQSIIDRITPAGINAHPGGALKPASPGLHSEDEGPTHIHECDECGHAIPCSHASREKELEAQIMGLKALGEQAVYERDLAEKAFGDAVNAARAREKGEPVNPAPPHSDHSEERDA